MHKVQIHLRYSDSDQMGVVYHANYFSFFEIGRTELLKSFGIDYYEIEQRGYLFPIRDVNCTYLKSIVLGETIFVETEMEEMTKVLIRFSHRLVDDKGTVKATGNTSIVSVKKSDFTFARMDKHLPDVYQIKEKMKTT